MISRIRIGDLLVKKGRITEDQLFQVLFKQKESGKKLGSVLLDMGLVTERELIDALEEQIDTQYVDLGAFDLDLEAVHLIHESFAQANTCIAFKKENDVLYVAMTDPMDYLLTEDIQFMTSCRIEPFYATAREIKRAIQRYYSKKQVDSAVEEFRKEMNETDEESMDLVEESLDNAPVIRMVNTIILQAAQENASDIHIEPYETVFRIRFRIDGKLMVMMTQPMEAHGAIVSRIKIMSNLDIAEKRTPQDGRIEFANDDFNLDMRVSTIPTVYGEKIVMRLINRGSFLKRESELGLSKLHAKQMDELLSVSSGIILMTGPTGSGKSTTLYAMIESIHAEDTNVITVEDPVEYKMEGINQVQVNVKAGLTFASGLRSILRQDPDVIMVGEIRDFDTAQIAIRASITGHLVLSTLHTNSSTATIGRLLDMGLEPYLISDSVVGVIAQRLVRKICPHCKVAYAPKVEELKWLGLESRLTEHTELYKGQGCVRCHNTGYIGRIPIHEFLMMNSGINRLVNRKASVDELDAYCRQRRIPRLADRCAALILEGVTTLEEFKRVVFALQQEEIEAEKAG